MQRTGDLLKNTPKGSSSFSRKTESRKCPHCGSEIRSEWVSFPPTLAEKYDREGEVWFPPCTPECEKLDELREWDLDVRRRRSAMLLEKSEMPERLSGSTLEAFDPSFSAAARRGLMAVRRYLEGWEESRAEGRGLYLCGGVGSGKTHLAGGMAQRLIEDHQVPTLFHTAPELLDRLRPSGADESEDWSSLAMSAELLVLDDLASERPTEWTRERLFVLVNHRYRRSLPTIYTSNVGPKDLAAHLGQRTASRIVETSEFVLMDGPDYRLKVRKRRAQALGTGR